MKIKPILAVLLSLGCLVASPVHAMLTVSGSGSVPGQTYSFGPTSKSTFVVNSGGFTTVAGIDANSTAWGNATGSYQAIASGSGTFYSQGEFNRSLTIANNTGFATQYSLNVFLFSGSMGVSNYYGLNGSGWASYDLDITKNGSISLFNSYAKIDSLGGLARSGSTLSDAVFTPTSGAASYAYYWKGANLVLDLGLLAVGGSMTIDFDLVSTVQGAFDVVKTTGSGSGCAIGYVCFDTGSAYVSVGPSVQNINMQSLGHFDVSGVTANQLPSPGTLSLLGLGILGLGVFRRASNRT